MSSLGSNTTAAAFIGASVTLVLVIIFMVLMVILVRQCLAFIAKRNSIRQQIEQHRQQRREMERQRRLSVTEPVTPTFDWHHSIRIAGTPPPTYHEAKKLPVFDDSTEVKEKDEKNDGIVIQRGADMATDGIDSEISIQLENVSVTDIPDNDVVPETTDNRVASMADQTATVITIVENDQPAPSTSTTHYTPNAQTTDSPA